MKEAATLPQYRQIRVRWEQPQRYTATISVPADLPEERIAVMVADAVDAIARDADLLLLAEKTGAGPPECVGWEPEWLSAW